MFLFYMVELHLDTIIQGQLTKKALSSIISFPQEWGPVASLQARPPNRQCHNFQNELVYKEYGCFCYEFLGSQISIKPLLVLYMVKA